MKRKFYDPYTELLDLFNRNNVKYVVVGMSGINYYASGAKETFTTQDFDIFIKPTIANLKKSIAIFRKLDYSLVANEQKVDDSSINNVVRGKRTIISTNPYGITFELILAVSGYTFSQMERDAVVFEVEKVPIKVGRLTKLLTSKKIAGRKKDKFFLKRYEILLKEKEEL